jgi:methionyl-tRNA synthetase
MKDPITYDDFAKLDIRIGTVFAARMMVDSDKLIQCAVDFGNEAEGGLGVRIIVSGIAQWKKPEELVGLQLPYIVNIPPRNIRGTLSSGMLLAAGTEEGIVLVRPEKEVPKGTHIG